MDTKILDISGLTDEMLRRAQVFCEPGAMRIVDDAMCKIREAAGVLKRGGLVCFPTETVYGIGADAFNEDAVRRVYAAKGRPSDNPMIVHIARASDIGLLSAMSPEQGNGITPEILKLADAFWPGPLTMVMKKKDEVPMRVTGGLGTIGVRLPDSPVAIELIRLAGVPVAAPSANLSGRPSPTKAEHVITDLDGKVDVILAGADCSVGIESTVVDMTVNPLQILRPGFVTRDDIESVIGAPVAIDCGLIDCPESEGVAPRAPGMKYKHYAPKADMFVVEGVREKVVQEISRLKNLNEKLGLNVGIILFEEHEYTIAAHEFYARLRELDERGADIILAGALPGTGGLGFAVMNRMMKAAGFNIIHV